MLEKVDLSKKLAKDEFKTWAEPLLERLGHLQRQARDLKIPIITVFEGWDAAGKGTIVNEMIQALDPRGFVVFNTHKPNEEELLRPYLWRFWIRIARRGRFVIFDRSWYTRLLFGLGGSLNSRSFQVFCDEIISFERQLSDDGTLIIKFFLHISKAEQKARMEKLQADKATSWRVTKEDWKNHKKYDKTQLAAEEILRQTDSDFAPWTIVEAHDRKFAVAKVLNTIVQAIEKQIREKELSPDPEKQEPVYIATQSAPSLSDRLPLKKLTSSVLSDVDLTKMLKEEVYRPKLKECQQRIRDLGYFCFTQRLPVVIVFEGWDAAGKGGCIRRLTQNMDHRGYTVVPVEAPTDEEKEYHYLWRFWKNVPKAGHMTIFDRSWYGRVLVERVEGFCKETEWLRAYKEINEMEEQWNRFGAVLVKFWLHISKEEQHSRFEARQANPEKQWKITGEDWRNREKWEHYENAVDEMFFRTSTIYAPWTIVEANDKYYARIKVLETIIKAIERKMK